MRRTRSRAAKPTFEYNQGGGAIGGPIRLPRLYDGTNRIVLLLQLRGVELQARAAHNADCADRGDAARATSPTCATPAGDLIVIYDPTTTRANPNGAGFIRDPFANNIIPANRLDAVAQNILAFYPLPNRAPDNAFTNANNWRDNLDETRDMRQWTTKVDHRLSSH